MDPKPIVIAFIVIALSIAIIGFIVFVVRRRNGKKPKKDNRLKNQKQVKITDSKRLCLLLKFFNEVYH